MKVTLLFLTTFLFVCISAHAQMFSVQSSTDRSTPGTPINAIVGFTDFADFNYFGDLTEGDNVNNDRYNFSGNLFGVRYESPLIQLYAALGNNLGDDEDVRATLIGANLETLYPILRRERFTMAIPLMLSTDYALVRTSETANTAAEFSQSSVYLGTGLNMLVRAGNNARIASRSTIAIGYTTGSLGAGGGASYKLYQQFRIYADNLIQRFGLVAGFDLRYSRFDNTNERFKYDYSSISIVAGFTF